MWAPLNSTRLVQVGGMAARDSRGGARRGGGVGGRRARSVPDRANTVSRAAFSRLPTIPSIELLQRIDARIACVHG